MSTDTRRISAPIRLGDGDSLVNQRIELAPDFDAGPLQCMVYARGDRIVVRDVRLVGAGYRVPRLLGLRVNGGRDLRVSKVRIEDTSESGLRMEGPVRGFEIEHLTALRCFHGLHFWDGYRHNPGYQAQGRVSGLRVRDTYGPETQIINQPSPHPQQMPLHRWNPDAWTGMNAWVGSGMRDLVVEDFECVGQFRPSTWKIGPGSERVVVRNGLCGSGSVQGVQRGPVWVDRVTFDPFAARDHPDTLYLSGGPTIVTHCTMIAAPWSRYAVSVVTDEGYAYLAFNRIVGFDEPLNVRQAARLNADFGRWNEVVQARTLGP